MKHFSKSYQEITKFASSYFSSSCKLLIQFLNLNRFLICQVSLFLFCLRMLTKCVVVVFFSLSMLKFDNNTRIQGNNTESVDDAIYFIINIRMLTEASKEFTFKPTSNNQSSKISSIGNTFYDKSLARRRSSRRHKIFEESTLFQKSPKKTNQSYQPNLTKNSQGGLIENIRPSGNFESLMASKEVIQRKLNEKYVQDDKQKLKKQLMKKQREITVLKLEIERSRRCEGLTKANEDLYNKLLLKINQTPTYYSTNAIQSYPLQNIHTPISSLTDIRLTPQKASPNKLQVDPVIQAHQASQSAPLKTIPQSEEAYTVAAHPRTETLKKRQKFSTNKKMEQAHANSQISDPVYLRLQAQMNSLKGRAKTTISDLPIDARLRVMNRALENSFSEYERRSAEKHSPQKRSRYNSVPNRYRSIAY